MAGSFSMKAVKGKMFSNWEKKKRPGVKTVGQNEKSGKKKMEKEEMQRQQKKPV